MPRERFSYSRLQAFEQCPAKYRFLYIERRPAGGESIESFMGSRLHQALEWLYQERRTGRNILFDDLLKQYRALWGAAWHDKIHIVEPGWQTNDYYQLGQRCLAGYYRSHFPFDEPVDATERTLTFILDDNGGYLVTAVLDRLDNHASGWWSIHDYKSGKTLLTAGRAQKDLQMKIYYLALKKNVEQIERVDVMWHFLRHGKEVLLENVEWNPKRIALLLKKRIEQAQAREAKPETLQPTESLLCTWCYYWDICPAKKGEKHPAHIAR